MRRPSIPRIAPSLLAAALLCGGSSSQAAEPEDRFTFQAGRLDADPNQGRITLQDSVVLRYGRYRLTGDRLQIVIADGAISVDGAGRVALCPCPDPPFTLAFSGGRLSPPGDLTLRFPRLELFQVPIFALPWLWIRAPEEPGLLPPILALRGTDGLLIGAGAHFPWRTRDGALRSLDLTAAGYTRGGVELGASLFTPASTARITFARIRGDRVALEARGALTPAAGPSASLAWEADVIRGARARSGTIDLATAAAPFDHATAEASIRAPAPFTALFAGGLLARAGRGDGAALAGPAASASFGGPLGSLGTWEAGASGLVLGGDAMVGALAVGRSSIGAELNGRPGPFALRLRVGGRALIADPSSPGGPMSLDAAIGARVGLELPLIRSFGAARGEGPLLHWIAPAIELGGLGAAQRGDLFRPLFAPVAPAAALVAGGVSTALGRYAGPSVRLDLRVGTVALSPSSAAAALALGRLTADAPVVAAAVELAASSGPAAGFALIAHARLGTARGPALLLDLTAAGGGDPRAARAVEGIPGAAPGAELSAFAGAGTTLGAALTVPFPAVLRTTLRADVDLAARELLAVRGLSEYRHPCGCLALGITFAHRTGRDGLDLAFFVDLAPTLRATLLR